MVSDDNVIFREVQRFDQLWIWALVLLPAVMAWYGAIEQLVYGRPYGDNPLSDQGMFIIWVIFGILFPLFIFSIRLIVEVRNDGVHFRFFPLHLSFRHYGFDDMLSYGSVTYRPLRDYGGWGIRYGPKGKAYNISGNRGMIIEFRNGDRLMLGSKDPDSLVSAIDRAKKR